jgi:hypothetical protein
LDDCWIVVCSEGEGVLTVPWSTDGRCVALCRLSFLCGCEPGSRTIHRGRTIHRRQQASSTVAADEMSRVSRVFPVSCPCRVSRIVSRIEFYQEFERTLKKKVEKGHKDRCKEDTETGTFWLQGAIPVQLRCKSGCTTRSTQRTQEVTQAAHVARQGAVPVQFRCSSGAVPVRDNDSNIFCA